MKRGLAKWLWRGGAAAAVIALGAVVAALALSAPWAWAAGGIALGACGVVIVILGVVLDPTAGAPRCPRCLYAMGGGQLKCPECGAVAKSEAARPNVRAVRI